MNVNKLYVFFTKSKSFKEIKGQVKFKYEGKNLIVFGNCNFISVIKKFFKEAGIEKFFDMRNYEVIERERSENYWRLSISIPILGDPFNNLKNSKIITFDSLAQGQIYYKYHYMIVITKKTDKNVHFIIYGAGWWNEDVMIIWEAIQNEEKWSNEESEEWSKKLTLTAKKKSIMSVFSTNKVEKRKYS